MHYIKCSNCGELSEVKTEYMVFCSFCGKKLENNFSSWHLKNPEKTFEEFKQLICVSDIDIIKNQAPVKPSKKKGVKYWIGATIGFAIFYVIGHFGSQMILNYLNTEKTEKQVLEMEWVRDTYGQYGLSVETPVKLTKGELPVPDNIKPYIEYIESFNSMNSKGFKIILNQIKYIPEAGPTNLQGAVNGSVMEMKMQASITEFVYNEEEFDLGNIQGIKIIGTYKESGINFDFIVATFASGHNLWQVIAANQSEDEIGKIATKRLIESIKIDMPTEVI